MKTTTCINKTIMGRARPSEEQKEAAVRLIRPGWTPVSAERWLPIGTKPTAERLRGEILRRASALASPSPRPSNWSWRRCIEWLEKQEVDAPKIVGSTANLHENIITTSPHPTTPIPNQNPMSTQPQNQTTEQSEEIHDYRLTINISINTTLNATPPFTQNFSQNVTPTFTQPSTQMECNFVPDIPSPSLFQDDGINEVRPLQNYGPVLPMTPSNPSTMPTSSMGNINKNRVEYNMSQE